MNILLKSKYAKYSKKLDDLDYEFSRLIEQCRKDLAELQYLPLNEHKQNRCKNVLQEIISRCKAEKVDVKRGNLIIEEAIKSLDKDSLGTINVIEPVKDIIRHGSKHAKELKNVQGQVLASFTKENLREKAIVEKIHANDDIEMSI